jgi:excisionase family DNA binding protein
MPVDTGPVIELLTVPEAAALLKISVPGLRRLQQRRLIPFIKVGGSVRFAKADLASYLTINQKILVGGLQFQPHSLPHAQPAKLQGRSTSI